jgi:hypothetical protein
MKSRQLNEANALRMTAGLAVCELLFKTITEHLTWKFFLTNERRCKICHEENDQG